MISSPEYATQPRIRTRFRPSQPRLHASRCPLSSSHSCPIWTFNTTSFRTSSDFSINTLHCTRCRSRCTCRPSRRQRGWPYSDHRDLVCTSTQIVRFFVYGSLRQTLRPAGRPLPITPSFRGRLTCTRSAIANSHQPAACSL